MYEMNDPQPARPRKVADMTHRAAGLDRGLNAKRSQTIADALARSWLRSGCRRTSARRRAALSLA